MESNEAFPRRPDRRLTWRPLTYENEFSDTKKQVELPFVVAIFADLSGHQYESPLRLRERKFLRLDADNFDEVMRRFTPRARVTVPNLLLNDESQLAVELTFTELDDFRPERIARQVPALSFLLELRANLASQAVRLEVRPNLVSSYRLLLNDATLVGRLRKYAQDVLVDEEERQRLEDEIASRLGEPALSGMEAAALAGRLLDILPTGGSPDTLNIGELVNEVLTRTERDLALQLNAVLHHQNLQQLEATWRGLAYLAKRTETGSVLKLKLFDAKKIEVSKDLRKAVEFDQSDLFKRLYEDEANVFGGEPCSLIIFDYFVSHNPADVEMLRALSEIGAAIPAPILLGVEPNLFGLDTWDELHRVRDIDRIFHAVEYTRWRTLRDSKEAAYLYLVLPRLLARRPWDTRDDIESYGFAFSEDVSVRQNFLWMNGAYGFAAVITNSFARDRWCAELRGPGSGRMDGLPAHYLIENGEIAEVVGPTEIDISDRRHSELEQAGLTPLMRVRNGDFAILLTPTAVARPPKFGNIAETERVRLSYQLEHVLCVARIAQTLRAYLRDTSGKWTDWDAVVQAVRDWLSSYAVPPLDYNRDSAPQDLKLAFPFRKVEVRNKNGEAGGSMVEVEIELNYAPKGAPIARVLFTSATPGLLSSRLLP